MLGEPEGLPKIFPTAQPCSPVVIGSMIHNMLLLNVEVHFLRTLVKECNFYWTTPYSNFVSSSKGTLICNSSSSILVLNRTSPSLLHTFVAYTTQLPIAIQHTGNSFVHQHIPRKRLRASSCFQDTPPACSRACSNLLPGYIPGNSCVSCDLSRLCAIV